MWKKIKALWTGEEGQAMVEYGLIIALIGVFLIGALVFLAGGLDGLFRDAAGNL